MLVEELDDSNRVILRYRYDREKASDMTSLTLISGETETVKKLTFPSFRRLLEDIFLPAGYPATVSEDYVRYQIHNATQAFCSSVAGLFASRAVLEGFGVGNADASATYAMLLTVLQDIFSRLTTIFGAYYFGTSLFPEAKTYRFLADLFNDTAMTLDVVSPLLTSFSFQIPGTYLIISGSTLRVASLCLSGSLRALCGVTAGGSKAALTMHFASAGSLPGDIGDLNAKDGSKETVLGLLGMLSGTLLLHYITTPTPTYLVLFTLIVAHLSTNYAAVRGINMRTLNRQRATIAWSAFRDVAGSGSDAVQISACTPEKVSSKEHILHHPAHILSRRTGACIGKCFPGTSLSSISSDSKEIEAVMHSSGGHDVTHFFLSTTIDRRPQLRVVLTEGCTPMDRLKVWVQAVEVCRDLQRHAGVTPIDADVTRCTSSARDKVERHFPEFVARMRELGWHVDQGLHIPTPSRKIRVRGENSDGYSAINNKKDA